LSGLVIAAGLGVLLAFRGDTESAPHWVKEHWLNAIAATALGTVLLAAATIVVPLVIRWLDRDESRAARRESQQRKVMLSRVRYLWITGFLEPSLRDTAVLALGLRRRPDAAYLGSEMIRRPGMPPGPVLVTASITELFDEIGGGLLILGAPGAGKTTMLLQLARSLVEKAEQDPDQPIPVVLNLASWAASRQPLPAWLAEELAIGYKVPQSTASAWIAQDALVLLLDGLDEVAGHRRNACCEAISAYRRAHGLVPMAVCSRAGEFEDLTADLGMDVAAEILPPADAEVDRYLGYLEAAGVPLADVRATLSADQDLRELLRSPLMLHVVARACRGGPVTALRADGTAEDRQQQLWGAYVARMFEQRPPDPRCGYTAEQAIGWLRWLARMLYDHDEIGIRLEALEHTWLPIPADWSVWSTWLWHWRADPWELGTLKAGQHEQIAKAGNVRWLIDWLIIDWVTYRASRIYPLRNSILRRRPFKAGFYAVIGAGLAVGLSRGAVPGLVAGTICGAGATCCSAMLTRLCRREVALFPVGDLKFTWRRQSDFSLALAVRERLLYFLLHLVLMLPLFRGAAFPIVEAITAEPGEFRPAERMPLHEITALRQVARLARRAGLCAGISMGTFYGLVAGAYFGSFPGFLAALVAALATGSLAWLDGGGNIFVRDFAIRAELFRAGVAPRQYIPFLDAMAERLLLRRTGNTYIFAHRLLRDYLGAEAPTPAVQRLLF
jgi:hypothetical protein